MTDQKKYDMSDWTDGGDPSSTKPKSPAPDLMTGCGRLWNLVIGLLFGLVVLASVVVFFTSLPEVGPTPPPAAVVGSAPGTIAVATPAPAVTPLTAAASTSPEGGIPNAVVEQTWFWERHPILLYVLLGLSGGVAFYIWKLDIRFARRRFAYPYSLEVSFAGGGGANLHGEFHLRQVLEPSALQAFRENKGFKGAADLYEAVIISALQQIAAKLHPKDRNRLYDLANKLLRTKPIEDIRLDTGTIMVFNQLTKIDPDQKAEARLAQENEVDDIADEVQRIADKLGTSPTAAGILSFLSHIAGAFNIIAGSRAEEVADRDRRRNGGSDEN